MVVIVKCHAAVYSYNNYYERKSRLIRMYFKHGLVFVVVYLFIYLFFMRKWWLIQNVIAIKQLHK